MTNSTFKTYMCIVCGFIYDEATGRPEDAIALDLPVVSIAPITWQAAVGLHRWKSKLKDNPIGPTPLILSRSQWPQAPLEHKADDGKAVGLLLANLAQRDARAGIDRRAIQTQAAVKKKAKRAQAKQNRELGQG